MPICRGRQGQTGGKVIKLWKGWLLFFRGRRVVRKGLQSTNLHIVVVYLCRTAHYSGSLSDRTPCHWWPPTTRRPYYGSQGLLCVSEGHRRESGGRWNPHRWTSLYQIVLLRSNDSKQTNQKVIWICPASDLSSHRGFESHNSNMGKYWVSMLNKHQCRDKTNKIFFIPDEK